MMWMFILGWMCALVLVGLMAAGLAYCEPKAVARRTPAWMAAWCLRVGAYVQAMGRECYHQCDQEKRKPIDAKLKRVYGTHKA